MRPAIFCKRSILCPKGDGGADHMVGENGTKTNGSKTTGKNGKTERVDVENLDPGKRLEMFIIMNPII